MIAVITLATFLILVVILRALLLAAIAVALNLVTVAVAFGVLTLLFDVPEGWPLGGHTYVDAIGAAGIFGIIFGLSIDYAVFLLMRMREHYENNSSNEEAIVFGLEKTARVITGAAAIMMAVFVAFAGADIATVSQLGTGLTVAVAARRDRGADRPAAGADAAARRPGLVAAAAAGENPARDRSSRLAGGLADSGRHGNSCIFDRRVEDRGAGWALRVGAGPVSEDRRIRTVGSSATMSSLPKLGLAVAVALLVAAPVALAADARNSGRIRRTGRADLQGQLGSQLAHPQGRQRPGPEGRTGARRASASSALPARSARR